MTMITTTTKIGTSSMENVSKPVNALRVLMIIELLKVLNYYGPPAQENRWRGVAAVIYDLDPEGCQGWSVRPDGSIKRMPNLSEYDYNRLSDADLIAVFHSVIRSFYRQM